MNILGLSGVVYHDASAALLIDGKLVAAAEEERFVRDKHAKGRFAFEAAKFCMRHVGVRPNDIDVVAIPYAKIGLTSRARWHYARRYWYAPERARDVLFNGNRRYRRNVKKIFALLRDLEIDPRRIRFFPVEHHLAHASS
ncbi:MAG: carbamoyltransferase N-terminal domain-containing protein, partial [Burkholderiales bacterium]